MKFLILIFTISITLSSFAQKGFKYDESKHIVYNENTPLFKIRNDSEFKSQVLVENFNDSLLVFFLSKEMRGLVASTKKNPEGSVFCKMCLLMTSVRQSVEVPEGKSLKYYAKMVYKNNLISGNKLDSIAVMNFVNTTGNPYSSKYLIYDEKTKMYDYPNRKNNN